jgi:signal transduction histidine kinase
VKISNKLSLVFCVAALFLIAVEISAVLVITHVNDLLNQTSYFNQQLEQVNNVLVAARLTPDRVTDQAARLDDLLRWARTDEERTLITAARAQLGGRRFATDGMAALEQLSFYYSRGTSAVHEKMLAIHQRAVVGIIVIMINSILLVVLLTALMRLWLLQPVRELGEATEVLAAGNFDRVIVSDAGVEFDRIATALNLVAARLRDIEKRLEGSSNYIAIGQACTHVTHNVRSLLGSIRSLAQQESRSQATGRDSRVGFNYIIATVNKLDNWVRDLHATVAPHNPNSVPHDIEPIIHDALSLLQPRLNERNLTVELQAADDLPEVVIDRGQFEQAFMAVVTNAIEASPDDGHIGITVRNGLPGRLSVRVEDQGAGMNETAQARAFEPFFTTKTDSAGLGLTIAQTIIQQHSGEIEIESAQGRGSRVSIHLPVVKPAPPASKAAPSASARQ